MIALDIGKHITEQYLQRIETGQSYSLQLITSSGTDNNNSQKSKVESLSQSSSATAHEVKSGESLSFIYDIETIVRFGIGSHPSTFYRQVIDFVKAAKCPVIVSCQNTIPVGLCKHYYKYLDFMHVENEKDKEKVRIREYMKMIYRLEKSGILKKLCGMVERNESITAILKCWEEETSKIKLFSEDDTEVEELITAANYNIELTFKNLYMKLHNFIEVNRISSSTEEDDVSLLELKLDYESLSDCSKIETTKMDADVFLYKVKSCSNGFLHSLPIIKKIPLSELHVLIALLKVYYQRYYIIRQKSRMRKGNSSTVISHFHQIQLLQ